MTQEDKQLLLADLCARVPYHPKGHVVNACNGAECDEWLTCATFTMFTNVTNNCRLYLRPMSSMTEEEYVYFMSIRGMNLRSYEIQEMMSENFSHPNRIAIVNTLGRYSDNIDWLNKNMFDYRGLIEKRLALEAPEGMYKKGE